MGRLAFVAYRISVKNRVCLLGSPVPTPTAADVEAAAAEIAEIGVSSNTTEGQTTVAMDPEKLLRVADKVKANQASAGANANGGPKSGWGMTRQARTVPPGAV